MNRVQLTDSAHVNRGSSVIPSLVSATTIPPAISSESSAAAATSLSKEATAAAALASAGIPGMPLAVASTAASTKAIDASRAMLPDSLDCAICLDNIRPKFHAKAILACQHEFHLSCISMAFNMGNKEMICPLCRFLHKNQPFMGSEDEVIKPLSSSTLTSSTLSRASVTSSTVGDNSDAVPATTGGVSVSVVTGTRNRHRNNSIHLQHNLSNLVQHQQRRRSMYDLRRSSLSSSTPLPTQSSSLPSPTAAAAPPSPTLQSSPSSSPLTATAVAVSTPSNYVFPAPIHHAAEAVTSPANATIIATAASTGIVRLSPQQTQRRASTSIPTLELNSNGQPSPSSSSQTEHPSTYISSWTWFMLYGLPFSGASLFLSLILNRMETLWSKAWCVVGSVVCYIICWAIVVAFLMPLQLRHRQKQEYHHPPPPPHSPHRGQDQEQDQSQDRDQDRHQGEDQDPREPHVSRRQAPYTLHGYNANGHGTGTRTANGESAPFGMAMAYEFDVQDSFTPTFNTATASSFYYSPVSHAGNSSLQLPARRTLEREQQQQQPQQQSRYVAAATSSPSAATATTTTTTTSFAANNDSSVSDADGVVVSSPSPSKTLSWLERSASRLTTHKMALYQFAKDLVTRLADFFEFMDDYSETVAHQS